MDNVILIVLLLMALIISGGIAIIVNRLNAKLRNDERIIERLDLIIRDLRNNRSD